MWNPKIDDKICKFSTFLWRSVCVLQALRDGFQFGTLNYWFSVLYWQRYTALVILFAQSKLTGNNNILKTTMKHLQTSIRIKGLMRFYLFKNSSIPWKCLRFNWSNSWFGKPNFGLSKNMYIQIKHIFVCIQIMSGFKSYRLSTMVSQP